MDFIMGHMWVLWLILAIIFGVIEAATLGLTTVWCAVGSVASMIVDLCGGSVTVQVIVWAVVSVICFIVCMVWLKPKWDKIQKLQFKPTNADRILGQEGLVIKAIDPIAGVGQVKVMGQVWSAKASNAIPEGASVKIVKMEGVKVVVELI